MARRSLAAEVVSQVLGWTYFVCWSLSFYPQLFLNRKRQSTVGMSFDYQLANALGFGAYTIYTSALVFDKPVRREYRQAFGDDVVTVQDCCFAAHALATTLVALAQTRVYERGTQRFSRGCLVAVGVVVGVTASAAVFVALRGGAAHKTVHGVEVDGWLAWLYWLSAVKLGVTLCKYVPQAFLNMKRQSTTGWSIENVLLDFTGGALSVGQLLLDGATLGWKGAIGDPIKFALGFVSMIFDILFMIQHYVLYNPARRRAKEADASDEDSAPVAPSFVAEASSHLLRDTTRASSSSSNGAPSRPDDDGGFDSDGDDEARPGRWSDCRRRAVLSFSV
mmetsp:Transcript_10897/g.44154  ORF Transcript_10897/g.44154 Transcript_10897/m.44154 type:complete len:335 (-) Transcript_10897:650-1654(-)